jgi:uncharacterized membrane protein YfcA
VWTAPGWQVLSSRMPAWRRGQGQALRVLRNLDPAGRGGTTDVSAPREMSLVSPREMTRTVTAYSITGIPAAALGARTLLVLPAHVVDLALGLFFLMMIPGRRWLNAMNFRIRLWQLALAGAVIGFLTGIVISTGPLSVPAFTSYGLFKGAFLSTEAASSLALMVSKVTTFRQLGALPYNSILQGLIIGASVMAGAFVGKAVVLRMSLGMFQHVLDGLLLCSGLAMLVAAAGW